MLSSLLRPKKGRKRVPEHSPFSSFSAAYVDVDSDDNGQQRTKARHASADFTESEQESEGETERATRRPDDNEDEQEEDGIESTPLLPIFSAAHLGKLGGLFVGTIDVRDGMGLQTNFQQMHCPCITSRTPYGS
jgi:hypothetical protein